jgi:hypothetical protein
MRTKYTIIDGETVGLCQPVYRTQYRHDNHTDCFKCNRKVSTATMYIDNDGSQRHFRCLSPERKKECE